MNPDTKHRFTPLLIAIGTIAGIFIGSFYTSHFSGGRINIINTGSSKVGYLLQLIDNNYVDTVDMNTLVEDAMPQILSELDPHSSYFGPKEAEESVEDLRGSFSGIGVKGEKGSKVKLGIKRHGIKDLQYFTVVRGDIPVVSVDAYYMMGDKTGYLHVKNFGEQTYAEMLVALAELNMEGMKQLIVDLRGNRGGYMHIAIQMVNEFLPAGKLIVYTEGRKSPREEFTSDGRGTFQKLPIVVLVDEGSASASEIFAGAIQDNDRGTIVGRRTFGKGLVQQPMEFRDGSVVRLTVARYYTPSGRCIQKPYEKGHGEEYENDLIARYERGEFFSGDSIHQDGEQYKTSIGRIVYGGGGITPDIFVPYEDTTAVTSYYREAVFTGLIRQFAFAYSDENRAKLNTLRTADKMEQFLRRENLLEKFAQFAEKRQLRRRNLMLQKSRRLFERNIYGSIIYNIGEMKDYLQFLGQDDPVVLKAKEILDQGKSFPTNEEL